MFSRVHYCKFREQLGSSSVKQYREMKRGVKDIQRVKEE